MKRVMRRPHLKLLAELAVTIAREFAVDVAVRAGLVQLRVLVLRKPCRCARLNLLPNLRLGGGEQEDAVAVPPQLPSKPSAAAHSSSGVRADARLAVQHVVEPQSVDMIIVMSKWRLQHCARLLWIITTPLHHFSRAKVCAHQVERLLLRGGDEQIAGPSLACGCADPHELLAELRVRQKRTERGGGASALANRSETDDYEATPLEWAQCLNHSRHGPLYHHVRGEGSVLLTAAHCST
eukprot:scaffold294511_cov31-Tisochrysis_lutea.AAC.2